MLSKEYKEKIGDCFGELIRKYTQDSSTIELATQAFNKVLYKIEKDLIGFNSPKKNYMSEAMHRLECGQVQVTAIVNSNDTYIMRVIGGWLVSHNSSIAFIPYSDEFKN